ncbi:hypothetical protein ABK040_000120 [Willaertia magna]
MIEPATLSSFTSVLKEEVLEGEGEIKDEREPSANIPFSFKHEDLSNEISKSLEELDKTILDTSPPSTVVTSTTFIENSIDSLASVVSIDSIPNNTEKSSSIPPIPTYSTKSKGISSSRLPTLSNVRSVTTATSTAKPTIKQKPVLKLNNNNNASSTQTVSDPKKGIVLYFPVTKSSSLITPRTSLKSIGGTSLFPPKRPSKEKETSSSSSSSSTSSSIAPTIRKPVKKKIDSIPLKPDTSPTSTNTSSNLLKVAQKLSPPLAKTLPPNYPINSFLTEYKGRKKKIEYAAGSSISALHAIERKIKEKFQIDRKEKIRLMYFDKQYKQWLDVDSTKNLNGGRVRVTLWKEEEAVVVNPSSSSNAVSFEACKGWVVMKTLGFGSFGTVNMCFDSVNNQMIAVKKILHSSETSIKAKIEREVSIMKTLTHEHIVQYKGVEFSTDFCYILMEFMSGGSLKQILTKMKRGFSEGVIQLYLGQILKALQYLHEEREEAIFHRDIKCDNLLLKNAETVKLGDFGESKLICRRHLEKSRSIITKTKAMTGTIPYMSIEQLKGEVIYKRSHANDIWSLGITILEMIYGKNPWFLHYPKELATEFHYVEFMVKNIHLIYEEFIPKYVSKELSDLILKCLDVNPEKRPKASELLKHEFLNIQFSNINQEMCDIYKIIDSIRDEYNKLHLAKLPTFKSLTKELFGDISPPPMAITNSFFE